jgi:hypothetical protein
LRRLWQCINERPLPLIQAAATVATEKAVRTRLEADQATAQMADEANAVAKSEVKNTAAAVAAAKKFDDVAFA